jgi:hypothetical protein
MYIQAAEAVVLQLQMSIWPNHASLNKFKRPLWHTYNKSFRKQVATDLIH